MKRIICNILLAAMLAAAFSAQAQRKLDLPYETSAYGSDKATEDGVIATVVDRRSSLGTDRSGYVSIENTNDCPVRVNFQVFGVTTDGQYKLTTDKDVTVGAKKVHNEVCYYREDGENKFKTFKISISVEQQKTQIPVDNSTVDNSPEKPIPVGKSKPSGGIKSKIGGKSGSGLISKGGGSGISSRGGSSGIGKGGRSSGIGKGGKLGNAPSVPVGSNPGRGSSSSGKGGSSSGSSGSSSGSGSNASASNGSGSSSSKSEPSDNFNSVLNAISSSSASQSDYSRAIDLFSSYIDQANKLLDQISKSSGSPDKSLTEKHKSVTERMLKLHYTIDDIYLDGRLDNSNKQKYIQAMQKFNNYGARTHA